MGPIRSRALKRGSVILLAVGLFTTVIAIPNALALTVANFEIDTNADLTPGNDSPPGDDWLTAAVLQATRTPSGDNGCTQTGGAGFIFCDAVAGSGAKDPTTFAGGTKEENPASWKFNEGSVTPKTDITNVYALGRVAQVNGTPTPFIINGMERLPKAGSVHFSFELNQLATTNADGDQIPNRRVNDIQVAYDMGGSRNSNLGSLKIRVFKAKPVNASCTTSACPGAYDYANPDRTVEGTAFPLSGGGVTASMNTTSVPAGPWGAFDEGYNLVNTIQPFGFAEAAINLLEAIGTQDVCLNHIIVKSRASESVTSQLKDTTKMQSFPFCGGLKVQKYIDRDESGSVSDGDLVGDPTVPGSAHADLAGWSFTVTGPNPSTNVVCSGVTNSFGFLECSTGSLADLVSGNYTVTENTPLKTIAGGKASFNTDPGPLPKTTGISKIVAVGVGSDVLARFGNTCFIDFTFTLTGVPTGQSGTFLHYTITAGPNASATVHNVALAATATPGSFAATVGGFTMGNTISYGYGINLGQADEQTVNIGNQSFSTSGHATCAASATRAFDVSTITGFKYLDLDSSGSHNVGEPGLQGFKFELRSGATVVATALSNASGVYTFSNIAPGSYTVHEVNIATGWVQTEPASNGNRNVTVNLGQNATVGNFGNTPLSKIDVTYTALAKFLNANGTESDTAATKISSIVCTDGNSNPVANVTTNTATANNLHLNQSAVTCVVTYTHNLP